MIPNPVTSVTTPFETTSRINGLKIFGFVFYSLILLLAILGHFTEYTSLFGGSGMRGDDKLEMNDREKDSALMKEKSKMGKFFLCWSWS